jgi:hypothetical protein
METLLTPECVLRTPIETLLGQHSQRSASLACVRGLYPRRLCASPSRSHSAPHAHTNTYIHKFRWPTSSRTRMPPSGWRRLRRGQHPRCARGTRSE